MLLVTCPVCGTTGDETEFHAGGEAHLKRPASHDPENVDPQAHHDYLYMRENKRGINAEMWQCTRGCGKWFNAIRDSQTLEFKAVYKMGEPRPDIAK